MGHSLEGKGLRRQVHTVTQSVDNTILGDGTAVDPAIHLIKLFQDLGHLFMSQLTQSDAREAEPAEVKGRMATVAVTADAWRSVPSCPQFEDSSWETQPKHRN